MTDERLDPRIDTMMAALYGELSESEDRAFRRLLEKDERLRAEFEELRATREQLGAWEVEDRVPSFVLVDEPSRAGAAVRQGARARAAGPGWLERVRRAVAGFGARPAWGLAAAAMAVLLLALTDFRVQRVDGGLAFRFGEPAPAPVALPAGDPLDGLGPGRSLEMGPSGGETDGIVPVDAHGYLTQKEFDNRQAELLLSLAQLLNQYGEQRDEEVARIVDDLYRETRSRQDSDYRELNRRIDALGLQLLRDPNISTDRIRQLLGPSVPDGSAEGAIAPNEGTPLELDPQDRTKE